MVITVPPLLESPELRYNEKKNGKGRCDGMALIYCVEDDENIRELVRYALCSQKFQAEAFPDGASFWKALEEKKPDLVLLDIMLPGGKRPGDPEEAPGPAGHQQPPGNHAHCPDQ